MKRLHYTSLTLAAGALSMAGTMASADQVILDDLIVDGSLCVGFDCVNGESFGFDTIRMKENNIRIKAQDTSNTASFPSTDWQLTFNETNNGGANKFSVDDVSASRTPFTIEGGAPSHSLYVDDGGRIGLGTSTPVVELHVKDGDTPTLRLEQDGSSGFTPQTWDVAGNETNFFVRDVTSGSDLVLRLRAGAPANSIFVDTDGDVGMGTSSPAAQLHVNDTDTRMRIESTAAGNNAAVDLISNNNGAGSGTWQIISRGGDGAFAINDSDASAPGAEFILRSALDANPGLDILGEIRVGGVALNVPDYVFAPDYELMSLEEVEAFIVANRHLPNIPSSAEIQAGGLNMTEMQMALLEKVEELTLHTLAQQKTIDALQDRLEQLTD